MPTNQPNQPTTTLPPLTPPPNPTLYTAARGLWTLTWRTKLTWKRAPQLLIVLLALPLLLALILQPGQTQPYLRILIDLYLLLIIPLTTLNHHGAMIRDDLQTDTLTYLTTRPHTRARLYLLKYLTQTLWLQLLLLLHTLALAAAGAWIQIPDILPLTLHLITIQALAVTAFGALAALLGLLTQKYLIAGIIYGFIIEFGIGQIPTNINNLSISRHLKTLLAHNQELAQFYGWTTDGTPFSITMTIAAPILFLTIGALLFTLREYHSTQEHQKT